MSTGGCLGRRGERLPQKGLDKTLSVRLAKETGARDERQRDKSRATKKAVHDLHGKAVLMTGVSGIKGRAVSIVYWSTAIPIATGITLRFRLATTCP